MMVGLGYSREEINNSLSKMKYDDITATYLLLGRKAAEVRGGYHGNDRSEPAEIIIELCLLFRWR